MEAPTGRFNGDREENSPSPPFQPPSYAIRVAPDKSLQWDPPADSEELAIALSYHFPLPQTLEAKMQAATQKWLHDRRSRYATTTSLERTQTKARRNAGQNVYGQIQVLADPERPLPRLRHPKGNVSSIRSYNSRDEVTNCVASPPHPPNGNARNSRPEGSNQQPSGPSRHPDKPCLISWKVETGDNSHRVPKKRRYLEDERLRVAKNRGNACEDHRRRRQKVCFSILKYTFWYIVDRNSATLWTAPKISNDSTKILPLKLHLRAIIIFILKATLPSCRLKAQNVLRGEIQMLLT
jgi:hypothetical protein